MLRAIEAVQTALTGVIVFLSEVFIAGFVFLYFLFHPQTLSLSLCLSSTTCLSGGSLVTLTSWPCITLWTWSTCSTVTVLAPCRSVPGRAGALQTHTQHCCVARASAFQQHQTKNKTVHTHNVERERHAQRVDTWPQFVLTLNLFRSGGEWIYGAAAAGPGYCELAFFPKPSKCFTALSMRGTRQGFTPVTKSELPMPLELSRTPIPLRLGVMFCLFMSQPMVQRQWGTTPSFSSFRPGCPTLLIYNLRETLWSGTGPAFSHYKVLWFHYTKKFRGKKWIF